jgi:hypothetical protein
MPELWDSGARWRGIEHIDRMLFILLSYDTMAMNID